jgi:hypothetical protein
VRGHHSRGMAMAQRPRLAVGQQAKGKALAVAWAHVRAYGFLVLQARRLRQRRLLHKRCSMKAGTRDGVLGSMEGSSAARFTLAALG